jgi:hypothetical protein
MTQPPIDDDFQDRIQHILNEKKKEDLREQYGMILEGHSEQMSPQVEGEWLDYITEFERQFENAKQIPLRERIGNPDVKPLAQIPDSDGVLSKKQKKVVIHEGLSEFKLTRSIYGGWDIIQASIPGWALHREK